MYMCVGWKQVHGTSLSQWFRCLISIVTHHVTIAQQSWNYLFSTFYQSNPNRTGVNPCIQPFEAHNKHGPRTLVKCIDNSYGYIKMSIDSFSFLFINVRGLRLDCKAMERVKRRNKRGHYSIVWESTVCCCTFMIWGAWTESYII